MEFSDIVIPDSIQSLIRNNFTKFPGITSKELNLIKSIFPKENYGWLFSDHLENLKSLIYIEFYYLLQELKKYSMKRQKPRYVKKYDKKFKKRSVLVYRFEIYAPQMDVEDPFVNPGDYVLINEHKLCIEELKPKLIIAETTR